MLNKKILVAVFSVLMCSLSFGHETASVFRTAESIEIRPIADQKPGSSPRRIPAMVPIRASIMLTSILIEFMDNLGTVEIELSNAATGEYQQGEVSSASGWAAVPFSGDEGFYIIRFTLPSGAQYYGEFEIAQ